MPLLLHLVLQVLDKQFELDFSRMLMNAQFKKMLAREDPAMAGEHGLQEVSSTVGCARHLGGQSSKVPGSWPALQRCFIPLAPASIRELLGPVACVRARLACAPLLLARACSVG